MKTTNTTKKTNLFVYSIKNVKVSRTYGGSNYTVRVYQLLKNDLKFIGERKACTRGHKGEDSEAFSVIVENCPEVIKSVKRRAALKLKSDPNDYAAKNTLKDIKNSGGYYFRYMEEFGLKLKSI
jgi:hypothetical protein